MMTPEEKLVAARCRLMTREPWYGHMAMMITWKKSDMNWVDDEAARSIGIKIASTGEITAYWYQDWVERMSLKQIYGTIEHMINHLVRLHPVRAGEHEKAPWNIATDMAVNGSANSPHIGYKDENGKTVLPCSYDVSKGSDTWTIPNYDDALVFADKKGIGVDNVKPHGDSLVFVPNDWPSDESAEFYYEKLIEQFGDDGQQGQQGQQCDGEGQDQCQTCGGSGQAPDDEDGDEDQQGQGQGQGQDDDQQGQGQGQGQGQDDDQQGQGGGGGQPQGECSDSSGESDGQGSGSPCPDCQGTGKEGGQSGGNGQAKHNYGPFQNNAVDDHSTWTQSDISHDEARQLVHDMVKEATDKSQGHTPGHLAQAIDELKKPIVRWREILRQIIGTHVGNRRKTYARRNRRYDIWGIKGISHHAAATVSVIIDTSGSIGTKELEQFFGEIEAISYRAKVNVLQWDHAFQGFDQYRRGDWKKITANGRGGTDMAAPVKWLEENGQVADLQIMLTDGYCNWPAPREYPMVFCITTDNTSEPEWGVSIRMKITE